MEVASKTHLASTRPAPRHRCDRAEAAPRLGRLPASARAVRRVRHRLRGDTRPLGRGTIDGDPARGGRGVGRAVARDLPRAGRPALGDERAGIRARDRELDLPPVPVHDHVRLPAVGVPPAQRRLAVPAEHGDHRLLDRHRRLPVVPVCASPPPAEGPRVRVRRHAADRQCERAGRPGLRAREPVRGDAEPAHGDRPARRHVGGAAVPDDGRACHLGALPRARRVRDRGHREPLHPGRDRRRRRVRRGDERLAHGLLDPHGGARSQNVRSPSPPDRSSVEIDRSSPPGGLPPTAPGYPGPP